MNQPTVTQEAELIAAKLTKAERHGVLGMLFWTACEAVTATFAISGIYSVATGDLRPVTLVFSLPILLVGWRAFNLEVRAILMEQG